MIRKFQRYIEESNWDDILIDGDRRLTTFCITMTVGSLIYFGVWCLLSLWG